MTIFRPGRGARPPCGEQAFEIGACGGGHKFSSVTGQRFVVLFGVMFLGTLAGNDHRPCLDIGRIDSRPLVFFFQEKGQLVDVDGVIIQQRRMDDSAFIEYFSFPDVETAGG
jgi:hypothetical protein